MRVFGIADLRELCGFVENGTSTVVRISQDDATMAWSVEVGKTTYYGRTMEQALDNAARRDTTIPKGL